MNWLSSTAAYLLLLPIGLAAQPSPTIEPLFAGFTRPVKVTHAYDARLFVAEIGGKIKVIKNGVVLPAPFLNIRNKINEPEYAGIFSIAFHPDYQVNGYFYVMYVVKDKYEVQISRFQRLGSTDSDLASDVETPILTIPYTDVPGGHRGGDMAFGKDNFLYISTGDNGPGSRGVPGDPDNNAQNTGKLFGKILRLDVGSPSPGDNPLQKIWALGLRNPWRFSFDRETGDLWIGDNGQDKYEEIDFLSYTDAVTSSRNFGWNYYEGNYAYKDCHCSTNFVAPVLVYNGFTYNGGVSASVMGGYVYRGSKYPSLKGWYFFGDYQSFKIGAVKGLYKGFLSDLSYHSLISFGEDNGGELYVVSLLNGTLGHLTSSSDPPLPVRLASFSAKPEGCDVLLTWRTTEEINFSRFEVERSNDGKKFQRITTVATSGADHDYTFVDVAPLPGIHYYRLKMLDHDGTFQISHMAKQAADCPDQKISIFPNPSRDLFMIKGLGSGSTISLYQISGRLILPQQSVKAGKAEINLKNYPTGAYILKIEDQHSGFVKRIKLVKD
jgi:glucose/arabinose dehydrogenase